MARTIKSFLAVMFSSIFTAFLFVLPTAEGQEFVAWISAVIQQLGIPTVVWAFVTAVIYRAWAEWRNRVNVAKAGISSLTAARNGNVVELY